MRWSLLLLALVVAGFLAPAPRQQAAAQKSKDEPEPADEEMVAPEKLGKLALTLDPGAHTATIRKVFFMPDGEQIITVARDHSIRFWDVATGKTMKVLHLPGFGGLTQAAMSRDGKRLAVASRYPEKDKLRYLIYVLALPEGRIERILQGHPGEIDALAISPDGKRLASAGAESAAKKGAAPIRLWDVSSDGPARVLRRRGQRTLGLAFSPDGSRLARVAHSPASGEIIDLAADKDTGKLLGSKVAWSPDGKTLATLHSPRGAVHLFDGAGKEIGTLPTHLARTMAFSADSRKILVTSASKVELFDVASGKMLTEFSQRLGTANWDSALSPDGRWAVTGGGTNKHDAYIWDTQDVKKFKQLAAPVWLRPGRAAWSTDGKTFSFNRLTNRASFHIGDLRFRPPVPEKEIHTAVLKRGDLSLKPTERPGLLPIWQVFKGDVSIAKLPLPGYATFVGKDQTWAALIKGESLLLCDPLTGKLMRTLEGHRGVIRGIAPSPDGRFLMTVSEDQTLRIWNPEREKPLLSMYVNGEPFVRRKNELPSTDWIIWTPEGYYAATRGGERLMGFTADNGIDQMPTFYPAERFRKQLYRPDVIKLLLEKGNLKDALETANAALKKQGKTVVAGVADPGNLLPPQASVQILDQSALPKVKLKVTAQASGKQQPITALRLMVDGRPLPGPEGYVEFKDGKDKAAVEWAITLPGAKPNAPYTLTVLARGRDTTGFSRPVEVRYLDPGKLPNMHVLAIGINQYRDKSLKLEAAAPDAQAIAASFQKGAKGDLFKQVNAKTLLDAQADRQAIVGELHRMRKQVKQNDLVVVFFAGHGVKNKNGFYLLTVEADTSDEKTLDKTCLSGAELRKDLADFPCQVLLMLDACHSAGFGEKKGEKGVLAAKGLKPATDDLTRDLTEDEVGVAVMCAAMGHEKAQEKAGNGLFTHAIVQALNKADGVPYNRHDHMLYLHHLQAFVFDEVKTQSEDEQHPFLSLPWVVESFPLAKFAKSSSGR